MVIDRFDVWLVNLNPTKCSEIRKIRPCLIISPDEVNRYLNTVIIAPMTTKGKNYPTRIFCTFQKKKGHVVLDQIRTIDKTRLIEKIGAIDTKTRDNVINTLHDLFSL